MAYTLSTEDSRMSVTRYAGPEDASPRMRYQVSIGHPASVEAANDDIDVSVEGANVVLVGLTVHELRALRGLIDKMLADPGTGDTR